MPLDTRKPSAVTESFRQRVAAATAVRGFVARQKGAVLVRRPSRGITHRITLGSSHYNAPGHVAAFVALFWESPDVAALEPGWMAGGRLDVAAFSDEIDTNVASSEAADALLAHILERLAWFDLLDDPHRLLVEASRRYVPGLNRPRAVAPYLKARLGAEAVSAYAASLLGGVPELWPGFLRVAAGATTGPTPVTLDEGAELAVMLVRHAPGHPRPAAPPEAVCSLDVAAANLRAHLGLQLRAWGEPEAAAELRRFDDARILGLYASQKALGLPVDALEPLQLLLDAVLGASRPPRRPRPEPRYFQYVTRHGPWLDR